MLYCFLPMFSCPYVFGELQAAYNYWSLIVLLVFQFSIFIFIVIFDILGPISINFTNLLFCSFFCFFLVLSYFNDLS